MINQDRFDSEYFKPDYLNTIKLLKNTGKTTTLGKLFKFIQRGSQPIYSQLGTIKVLRSVNVGKMSFNDKRQEYVTDKFFNSQTRGKVNYNDILITSTGVGTLGRTSIWASNEKAFCDGHITILRKGSIDPYLITTFLNSKYGLFQFDQNYRGSSGQIEIYPFDISKFIIPEILFDYEKEIGDMVREAFTLEQEAQTFFQEAKEILDKALNIDNSDLNRLSNKFVSNFSDITINNRFDSEYYNPKAKKIVARIKEMNHVLIGTNFEIKNGFPWKSDCFLEDNSGLPVVRIRDIKPTFIDNENLTSLERSYAESIDFQKAQPNDIVIGMDGAKYFYGSLIEEECLVNQRVCHITPKVNTTISSEYTTFIINSEIGQSQLLRDMTIAGTVGHITNVNVAKLIIPIFSEEIHSEITKLIRKSIDTKKTSKNLLRNAISRVESIIESFN
jgi:hypothetical protein